MTIPPSLSVKFDRNRVTNHSKYTRLDIFSYDSPKATVVNTEDSVDLEPVSETSYLVLAHLMETAEVFTWINGPDGLKFPEGKPITVTGPIELLIGEPVLKFECVTNPSVGKRVHKVPGAAIHCQRVKLTHEESLRLVQKLGYDSWGNYYIAQIASSQLQSYQSSRLPSSDNLETTHP